MTSRPSRRGTGQTLLAVAAGGALGGSARYALLLLAPHDGAGFPWTTFAENVTGSFAMGALVVLVTEVARPHRLLRPFLGVGLLGGFTTFSTYAVDIVGLVRAGSPGTALAYLLATVVGALAAAWAGMALTRALAAWRRARSADPSRKDTR
ncbi:CrcB family protein [Nocardiopsis sp. NRRL B-16309]|uniref:fluoride efflux transporter FluC n=1 Tax=Nocardiopsis sp. NRRL B-16309 TaxID=1519494 RepID=UPI0006B03906|nr:CrcB family protein [Nocardiopsis sp. NRRL B-16309]